MIENRWRWLYQGAFVAFVVAVVLLGFAVRVSAQDNSKSSTKEGQAAAAAKDKWQEGEACVKNQAPDCPSQYRGVCRTGRADGCSHDSCTAAKNQARATLRTYLEGQGVLDKCAKYIQSTAPCKNGPGCR